MLSPALVYPETAPGAERWEIKINYRHLLQVLASQRAQVNLVNLAHPGTEGKERVYYSYFSQLTLPPKVATPPHCQNVSENVCKKFCLLKVAIIP